MPAAAPRSEGVSAWPRLLVMLLLACLLVQGTAVQSHIHFAQPTNSNALVAGDRAVQLSKPVPGDPAGECPLCQEMAMAGAYLLPTAIVLPPPPAPVLLAATATITELRFLAPALGWRSRAPPR